jgi:hypothetical protein
MNWNQLPADLLASFCFKLNTFRKRVKKVVTNKSIRWGLNVNTCIYCVLFTICLIVLFGYVLLYVYCIGYLLLYVCGCLHFTVLCLLVIVLCTYYFMFVFYCCVVLLYSVALSFFPVLG